MSATKFTLNKLRSVINYGLYVSGNTTDPIFSKGWIKTRPNILIKGSSCYIDYSHAFNTSDLMYFNQTFKKLGVGATFYMTPSEYYDAEKNILKNLGGTFSVNKIFYGTNIIVADIISGISGSDSYDYFTKENFNTTPQFIFQNAASFTGYYLINSLPNLALSTFKSSGVLGNAFDQEEYLSLSAGICENGERIQILGCSEFKDGQEILYFLNGGTFQDMGLTKCNVDFYLRGNPESLKAPITTSVTGIYVISDLINNSMRYCFENQSLNQATLRTENLNRLLYSGQFWNCKSCMDLVYGEASPQSFAVVGDLFDSLISLSIVDGATANVSSALTGSFVVNSTTIIRIPTLTNKTLKIDLSHPTLIDYDLTIYTDSNRKTLISSSSFQKYGVIGYNNSFGIIKNILTSNTLYCVLQGPSTIFFQIGV
jgi:hypothetical protein